MILVGLKGSVQVVGIRVPRQEVGAHTREAGPSSVRDQYMLHYQLSRVGQQLGVLQVRVEVVIALLRVLHSQDPHRGLVMVAVIQGT